MRRVVSLILVLVLQLPYVARSTSLYRNITMDDGLPANTVRNIVQDGYGFIWLGTDNGLCRYDGTHVQIFPIVGLGMNQYVSALLAVDDGLYIGTEQGVFYFDFPSHVISRLPLDIHSTVSNLSIDKGGNLWVSTLQQGVWRFNPRDRVCKSFPFNESKGAVSQVFVDSDNRIWSITNWGSKPVQRLNKIRDQFEPVNLKFDGSGFHSLCMMQAKDGTLWLGSWEEGLLRMTDNGELKQMLSPSLTKVGSHIHSLYELSADCICIACDDGVICFNPHTGEWHRLQNSPATSFVDRFAYSIMRDTEGGLWVGTFYGGVHYLSPVSNRFDGFTADGGRDALAGHVISRFCEDRQGRVWIASDDGGLICYLPQERRFSSFPHQEDLRQLNVHALCMDGDDLWIGTYTGGIYVLGTRSGKLQRYGASASPHKLSDPSSYAIYCSRKGDIWVASMDGLNRFDRQTGLFRQVKNLNALTIDIDEDASGCLWLSTQGGGLWRFNPANSTWKHFVHNDEDETSLPNNQVNCAHIDANGRLWVATVGGLCLYDRHTQAFRRIPLDIPTQNIMSIVEGQEALWLSSDKGIMKYDPTDGTRRFTRQDGLVSEQFQPNAGLKTTDGRIYFGTTNGFNTFYPHQIKTNNVMPPVYITALEVLNHERQTEGGLPRHFAQTDELVLDYSDGKMFTLSFASLSYCSPDKNDYAYRLDGFDKDWNYVGSQHKATYTNIAPGTYTFRVKATNNDGIWSPHEATLRIVVHPPFWWSWYAKVLYLLLAVALLWWYIHYRLNRAEHRHRHELQHLKEMKEVEVREARLNFFTMIAHEIRTPVSLIIGPLEQLLKVEEKKTTEESEERGLLRVIDHNAHRLLELVNQLLDFRKVEQQSLVMHFAPQNVGELLRDVGERFAPTFAQGGKHFTIDYPDESLTAIIDREGITKVISNLLTNANKYTRDDVRLACLLEPDGEHFRITVTDNGVGIREEDRQRIFEPFYQAMDNKPGTGIGLSIVRNIVELHHGTISVVSEVGQGTSFILTLPVNCQPEGAMDEISRSEAILTSPSQREAETLPTSPSDDGQGTSVQKPVQDEEDRGLMLIVDDNEDMVEFLSNTFRRKYRLITAHDGIEALDLLRRREVTLIISDWMMPRMDGAELCRRVRSNPATSHISFVMLTAKTDNDSKVEGLDVGADVYVEKPFSVQYLEACIRNLLDMRQRLRERFSSQPLEPLEQIAFNPTDSEFLAQLTKVIEDNFSNPALSVNFLAEQLAISRSGLFAKIKALVDVTPNEMIQLVRLKRAAALLAEGRYKVNEVCYMVGFTSPSYFTKCFQKQFGMRPSDTEAIRTDVLSSRK